MRVDESSAMLVLQSRVALQYVLEGNGLVGEKSTAFVVLVID